MSVAKNLKTNLNKLKGSQLLQVEGMQKVEALISCKLQSEAALIQEIGIYLHDLGGKRIRPAICLLCAQALGMQYPSQSVLDVCAGIELIHMATLLHDDIIDKSTMRRHKQSALVKYGSNSTLLCGDFLLVRAFSLCAKLDQLIIDATERACMDLTEGEILETALDQQSHSEESSLNIARKKTAALFRLAALCASHLAGQNSTTTKYMANFGESLGIAFQILDDILDVISSEDLLGKKSGTDLRERKPSLVNVLWLASGDEMAKQLLQPAQSASDDDLFVENALHYLRQSKVISACKQIALNYANQASQALKQARESATIVNADAFGRLENIIKFTVERMN